MMTRKQKAVNGKLLGCPQIKVVFGSQREIVLLPLTKPFESLAAQSV